MLELIHSHWKRRRVIKIKCKGVPTVDMNNVCHHLEVMIINLNLIIILGIDSLFNVCYQFSSLTKLFGVYTTIILFISSMCHVGD